VKGAHDEFAQARELDPTNAWALEGLVITQTKLLPVHRRWVTVVWCRLMERREESLVFIGAVTVCLGLLLLVFGTGGVVLPSLVTAAGAGLPMLDAWRRGNR
jgi:hypothetical protein